MAAEHKRREALGTSLGRLIHTQQEVRTMLKNMTNSGTALDPPMAMESTKYRRHRQEDGDAATVLELGPQYLNFTQPPHHRSVAVHCAVCRTCVPGGTGGMLYNGTVLKPWLPLCDVCHRAAAQPEGGGPPAS